MNKIEIQVFKATNVTKTFSLILIGLLSNIMFAQASLKGTFCIDYALSDFSNCLSFVTDKGFKYSHAGHLGIIDYGIGEYKLIDNQLILNYNKTKPLKIGHHVSEIWENNADSIAVHFSFFDFDNIPIPYVNYYYKDSLSKNGYQGGVADKDGQGSLKLKKEKNDIMITVSNIGFRQYSFPINRNYNYDVSVFLESEGNGIPIKNQLDTLKIMELKENYFKVIEKDGKITTWLKR